MKKALVTLTLALGVVFTSACSIDMEAMNESPVTPSETFNFEIESDDAESEVPNIEDMEVAQLLDGLKVEEKSSKKGYKRPNLWGAASTYNVDAPLPSNCSVREAVLYNQGENVKVNDKCEILQGMWKDPYNGKTYSYNLPEGTPMNIRNLEIEHIVPLANAYVSGANEWTDNTFKTFAHDVNNLIVVNGSDNSAKSDSGPEKWIPSNTAYYCEYATSWIQTKTEYELSVTVQEKSALENLLTNCAEG